jgi:hypothetical protein
MRLFTSCYDFLLKRWLDQHIIASQPKPRTMIRYAVLALMLLGMPVLATAPSATDNTVTRFFWWLVQLAFYGVGGVIVMMGIIIPLAKRALGYRVETNTIAAILWAVGLLAAPSLLQMGIDWFNADPGSDGLLQDMQINLGGGSTP